MKNPISEEEKKLRQALRIVYACLTRKGHSFSERGKRAKLYLEENCFEMLTKQEGEE